MMPLFLQFQDNRRQRSAADPMGLTSGQKAPPAPQPRGLDKTTASSAADQPFTMPCCASDNNEDFLDVPEVFCCPITMELFNDPVILLENGHTYERSAIREWFTTHNTNPITNKTINNKAYKTNWSLKHIVHHQYPKAHKETITSTMESLNVKLSEDQQNTIRQMCQADPGAAIEILKGCGKARMSSLKLIRILKKGLANEKRRLRRLLGYDQL